MGNYSDYYNLLGLSRDANPKEIRRAYQRSALHLHPDVNKKAGETELFLKFQKAYDVLSDPEERKKYDTTLPPETPAPKLSVSTIYSSQYLSVLDEPQILYTLVEIKASLKNDFMVKSPLNISLIIDSSTSMKGERLNTVKKSIIDLIRHLEPESKLSIVTFSDRAHVILPADNYHIDRKIESKIQMIEARGGTEIFHGLEAGFNETLKHLLSTSQNHLILLTDGHTYGDEQNCFQLAEKAANFGIGVNAIGVGSKWNDAFIDRLTALTGGSSRYVSNENDMDNSMQSILNNLRGNFSENISLDFKTDKNVKINYVYRLSPETIPLQVNPPIRLGGVPIESHLSLLFEFQISPITEVTKQLTLFKGNITLSKAPYSSLSVAPVINISRPVQAKTRSPSPPKVIADALFGLIPYQMQERAYRELSQGNTEEATRCFHNLAGQLFSRGEDKLGQMALQETVHLNQGKRVYEHSKKQIKYRTRALLLPSNTISTQKDSLTDSIYEELL